VISRERRYGDLLVRFQYVKADSREIGGEHEPALVLCRPQRSKVRAAWVIMLSAAYKYVDDGETGRHSKYMVDVSESIAKMLHLPSDRHSRFLIAEAILDSLPDLLDMPPWEAAQKAVGEVELMVNGQKMTRELLH